MMGRGVCDCCAKLTVIFPSYERNESLKHLTQGLRFCSKQCFVRFRFKALSVDETTFKMYDGCFKKENET